MEVLEILQSAYSSIQDSGRFGFRSFAIPQSGCFDYQMHSTANYLVANKYDDPCIELIGGKLTARCLATFQIGVAGINVNVRVNNQLVDLLSTINLTAGDELEIQGSLAYISIAGSLIVKRHFESASTYPLAELGAPILKRGHKIEVVTNRINPRSIKHDQIPTEGKFEIIRLIEGPEWDFVSLNSVDFEKINWKISNQSNRIGIRLLGESLNISGKEMPSVPTFPGTIQLPPDGQPIILMNDAQTTGGYPRIGQVIKADLPRLARLMMGGTIRFKFVTIPEARYIFERQQSFIKHEFK